MSAMEQDLRAGQKVTRVFAEHELSFRVTSHLMLITEAALAISLQGRYSVAVDYYGAAHQLRVNVRELRPAGNNRTVMSSPRYSNQVALPKGDTDPERRAQAMAALSHTLQTLHRYLEDSP